MRDLTERLQKTDDVEVPEEMSKDGSGDSYLSVSCLVSLVYLDSSLYPSAGAIAYSLSHAYYKRPVLHQDRTAVFSHLSLIILPVFGCHSRA